MKYKLERLADLYVREIIRLHKVLTSVVSDRYLRRALKSWKLSSKFIRPFKVLSRIGPATYRIALPSNLSNLHMVFHVSQLRQYVLDPSHVIDLNPVQVRENLSYDVYIVRIVNHRVKKLRGKEISLVKVIWSSSDEGDATWETKSRMREMYL
ncbi:uncharacterized protein LOC113874254 [Abrus precatorius]|uniref:Uncharacterized protein LOC113874254 n=1 Tax=Abrus precatorius TaxID=3816 RepID=A0A8B8MHT9_ABRPR|nr:uncharacterized protein LOC113874254 [Abrus precatorius]